MVHNIDILILASFYILHLQNIRLFYFTFIMKTYTIFYSMPIIESLIFEIFETFFFLIFGVDNQDKFFYLV